jgi:hypothetical protein
MIGVAASQAWIQAGDHLPRVRWQDVGRSRRSVPIRPSTLLLPGMRCHGTLPVCADYPAVTTWLASMIAVAGTLLGSTIAYVFQRSNTARAESFARDERLRQERIAAYSAYAGAITELRRGVITLWFIRHRHGDSSNADVRDARIESDRLGASAAHARFRVQLLAGDADLVALADAAAAPVNAIAAAADRPELVEREDRSDEALRAFITAAGIQIR